MILNDLEKQYCNFYGWNRHDGIWIDSEMLNSDYDKMFFPEDMAGDVVSHGYAWTNDDGDDEAAYDDCDIVEHIEDYAEVSFEEWKLRNSKQGSKK